MRKKSAIQLRQLQKRKLREMLVYAYQHSPYYRDTFEAAGITGETVKTAPLSAFPTIDKAGLLEHFDRLITVPNLTQEELRRFDETEKADRRPYKGQYHVVHSSGSTGTPGYFLYDENAWNRMLVGIIRGRRGGCPCRGSSSCWPRDPESPTSPPPMDAMAEQWQ